ncbi:hypothetical protein HT136_25845 [Novosphingobium profundi]|nr:hypothetical protein [Novosphingobium profundi]
MADRQLELYLAFRCRLLTGDFMADEGTGSRAFAEEAGLPYQASVGLLNGLSSDGYLERRGHSYFPVLWDQNRLSDCFDRLGVLVGICARRIVADDVRMKRFREVVSASIELKIDDENLFLKYIEGISLLFSAGSRSNLSEVVGRIVPPAFFRVCWNTVAGKRICTRLRRLVNDWCEMETEKHIADVEASIIKTWLDLRAQVLDKVSKPDENCHAINRTESLNRVRERDFRGRAVNMSLPAFPILIPFLTASFEPWVFEGSLNECVNADQ